jgi:hypothetical protein
MRTSLGVHEWVWWLMTFGSAALTFIVRSPRILWSVLLAGDLWVLRSADHFL